MNTKDRAEKYLSLPCLGYTCSCPGEPDDYDCEYPHADLCDYCVCNFGRTCTNSAYDPVTGKWIGKKVLKCMMAKIKDFHKKPAEHIEIQEYGL